jgi:hypothetical protein
VILERCLRKDSKQRTHDAADVRIEIDDAVEEPVHSAPVAVQSKGCRSVPIILVLLAGVAIATMFGWIFKKISTETPVSSTSNHYNVVLNWFTELRKK